MRAKCECIKKIEWKDDPNNPYGGDSDHVLLVGYFGSGKFRLEKGYHWISGCYKHDLEEMGLKITDSVNVGGTWQFVLTCEQVQRMIARKE